MSIKLKEDALSKKEEGSFSKELARNGKWIFLGPDWDFRVKISCVGYNHKAKQYFAKNRLLFRRMKDNDRSSIEKVSRFLSLFLISDWKDVGDLIEEDHNGEFPKYTSDGMYSILTYKDFPEHLLYDLIDFSATPNNFSYDELNPVPEVESEEDLDKKKSTEHLSASNSIKE